MSDSSRKHDLADQDLFEEGLRLRDEGLLEDALDLLLKLRSDRQSTANLESVIGGCFWDLGDLAQATQHFQNAMELKPTSTVAALGLFHTLWESDRKRKALAEARRFKALTGSREFDEILSGLADRKADNES